MNKKERIYNAVQGKEVDQLPYAIWTHLPGIDLDPDRLAQHTCEFVRKYDTDLVKTMNNGMYATEDFGVKVDYSQIEKGGVAKVLYTPVETIEDWAKIKPLSLDYAEALNRELHSLKETISLVGDDIPVLFTTFSPFTTANKLCGGHIIDHIKSGKTAGIHKALEIITDITVQLVKRAGMMGCDGLFFASQMSSYDVCDEDIFREFGAFYDRQVLEASNGFCDTLHAHGTNIMFDILKDYPVDIFNWHCWESTPDLETAAQMDRCLMGGIVRGDITNSNYAEIDRQITACWNTLKGHHHILSPGCVIRYPLNDEALAYVREAKNRICI
ncbi:MAG: hypothetical protein IJI05_05750 [Erysipelotrichaceae bacterium]|nr:hypothetical protein [Erysipelotrichaceae bacterium]